MELPSMVIVLFSESISTPLGIENVHRYLARRVQTGLSVH